MTRSRILFITQTAHVWGGVETWLENVVETLSAAGWDVVVGVVKGRRWHNPKAYLAEHRYSETIEIECLTATREGRARAVTAAIGRTRPGVVVPVNVGDTFEAVSRVKQSGERCRLLVPLHGMSRSYVSDLERFAPVVDRVVAVNRLAQAAAMAVPGLESERVGYAPCGAEEPTVADSVPPVTGPFRVGFAGRLEDAQKNCKDVIGVAAELWRRGREFRLEIAGDGAMRGDLEKMAKATGVSERVRFRGVIPPSRLSAEFYARLSALLITSTWETGPIVAWEAMLHGIPIVTTDFVGLRAEGALRAGTNCLVAGVGDVRGLADQLEKLMTDRALVLDLGRAARETAKERYTRKAAMECWLRELERCTELPITKGEPCRVERAPSGRLDVWLGSSIAEDVRRVLRLGRDQTGPGGEWPHALSPESPEAADLQFLRRLEQGLQNRLSLRQGPFP